MQTIDINCDMGESYGHFKIGNDHAIFPYISSCNIACGFHGGDPFHIAQTIQQAVAHGVRIGAHPSYPDLAGFGRRKMQIPKTELAAIIKYQVKNNLPIGQLDNETVEHILSRKTPFK